MKRKFEKIKIGISGCLLGQNVRHNGGHKRNRYCTDQLSKWFDFQPACPEMAIGMSAPRPALRLIGDPLQPRMVESDNQENDYTDKMQDWSSQAINSMSQLSGYILADKSPSCGLFRVKCYNDKNHPEHLSRGIFAKALTDQFPLLPVEESGRLNDPQLRENFIMRVFVYRDWQQLMHKPLKPKLLINFWAQYKYLAMAHGQAEYRKIGRLIANLKTRPIDVTAEMFIQQLMQHISKPASRKNHSNVMQHLQGFLKAALPAQDRTELSKLIERYRKGIIPLEVPMTLLRHHFSHQSNPWVELQVYFEPHPQELELASQI